MSGWLPANNLTTSTAHTPLAVYAPTAWMFTSQRTRHVVFQNYDANSGDLGQLIELHANPHSDTWILNNLTTHAHGNPPLAFTTASGYLWSKQPSQHVVYQGRDDQGPPDGHVHELVWTDDDGWRHTDLTAKYHAPLALSEPFGFETKYDHTQRVVYQGRDLHIYHMYNSGGGWHYEDITAKAGASPSPLADGPTAYSFEAAESVHVLVRTVDGHILEYYDYEPTSWQLNDLTMVTGAPPANSQITGGSAAVGYAFEGQGTQHVVYIADDSHIIELWGDTTPTGWRPYNPVSTDLTSRLGFGGRNAGPLADREQGLACYAFESSPLQPQPTQHIFFVGTDGCVHELWWDANGWHENPLSFAGSLPVQFGVAAFVDVEEGTQNVFYVSDHDIIELQWTP
jgi:hypothetical protein